MSSYNRFSLKGLLLLTPKSAAYSAVPELAATETCAATRAAASALNQVVFASKNTVDPNQCHVAPITVQQVKHAAMRAVVFAPLPERGVRKRFATRSSSNVGGIPALKATSAVTKAAASALLLVESVRNNFANQFAPPQNVVRQNALLARNAAIPVVEYALLLAGFVRSNFANPLRRRSKLEATQFDHVLECLLLRI
ncbi:hypothetical protein EMCG_06723 [[Emmonsia] crescens]|uniref:Uncharacterized protein n=1 Tax=[Emmonsia] crescens TaxID=73230 RepID=A0A0G2IAV9_9EURO|nr:hypothetical protein EMCG_06723 [Emmonsia crescens UAMH 3008]